MVGEGWIIHWKEYSSDTFLHGSKISYHKNGTVKFRNSLMAPGTIIKQWYSKTNYQAQRIEPALPMIDGEKKYQLTAYIDCPEQEEWLIRLVFYDRYEIEAGSITTRDKVTEFICPLNTYCYRMQLINGGMTWFRFHSIVIREIEYESEKKY